MLRVKLTRDHLAAISGITPDGRLLMQMQDRAYRAEDVVRFLRLLLRKIKGKLLVIWDGSPIHRAQEIKAAPLTRSRQATPVGAIAGLRARIEPG